MFNSPIFETILSLTLVIFIFSILVTCVQEGYVGIFKSRGKMLESAIGDVLNDNFNKNFAYLLYQHPLIDLLKRKQGELPSYIDGKTFANALIELIAKESTEIVYEESPDKKTMLKRERFIPSAIEKAKELFSAELKKKITEDNDPAAVSLAAKFQLGSESLNYSDLKKLLLSFESSAIRADKEEALLGLKVQIENWYNNYMDRVTGWYKRKVRRNIFYASAVVTLFFNLNFFTLSKNIYADSKLRGTLTAMADSLSKEENPIASIQKKLVKDSTLTLEDINVNAILGVELPIGWKITEVEAGAEGKTWFGKIFRYIGYFFEKHFTAKNVIGWIIFVMALSLGAPFWFDVMKKLVNMRSAGISPQQKESK